MKRALSIILLTLFLFYSGGFLLLFKIQQFQIRQEIKKQMKENIPLHELTRFTITPYNKNQFIWEHSKEFQHQGKMYDVVRKEIVDDQTINYYCISDSQETGLFKKLDMLMNSGMDAKSSRAQSLKNLFKFLSNLFSAQQNRAIIYPYSKCAFAEFNPTYAQPWADILEPPPKLG